MGNVNVSHTACPASTVTTDPELLVCTSLCDDDNADSVQIMSIVVMTLLGKADLLA